MLLSYQLKFYFFQLREDVKKGVYVENLSEFEVQTVSDILSLLTQVRNHYSLSFLVLRHWDLSHLNCSVTLHPYSCYQL